MYDLALCGKKLKNMAIKGRRHFLSYMGTYFVLFGLGFIFLYPIFYMVVNSVMSASDLADPSVVWIPRKLYWGNLTEALQVLDFGRSFRNSILVAVVSTLFQTFSTAIIGFGLARFQVPLKKLWIGLIAFTFFIPVEITSIPRYVLFYRYGMINTLFPFYLPALLGQGLYSAIFILVFYQFFQNYPVTFDEAASLDGAGWFKIFYRIALPMSIPAIVLSLLFSFVWYWNETTQSQMYFGNVLPTLMIQLSTFDTKYKVMISGAAQSFRGPTQAITLAGTFLSILPMLVLYLISQRWFVSSIEHAGITGE